MASSSFSYLCLRWLRLVALVVDLADKFLGRLVEQREAADDVLDHASGRRSRGVRRRCAVLVPAGRQRRVRGRCPQQVTAFGPTRGSWTGCAVQIHSSMGLVSRSHVRVGPPADGAFRVDGDGRRVCGEVEVESVCDGLVAKAFSDSPVVCLSYGGRLRRIDFEEGFLAPLVPLVPLGVRCSRNTAATPSSTWGSNSAQP
jgi:hypothetical protein